MTTAHRPTWKPATGRGKEGGYGNRSALLSHLDLPSHTQLKFRHDAVDKKQALRDSLLKLEAAEHAQLKTQPRVLNPLVEEQGKFKLLTRGDDEDVDVEKVKAKYKDDDDDEGDDNDNAWSDDDDDDDLDDSDTDDDDDDDDDSDDDEAALQAELAKIRAERDQQQQQADEEHDQEAALVGNPLLSSAAWATGGRLKRRWNDDVVFRNQAKGEPAEHKRFINDTVRNDFHKRFMNKFIK